MFDTHETGLIVYAAQVDELLNQGVPRVSRIWKLGRLVRHHDGVGVDDLAAEVWSRPPRLGATRLVAIDGPGGAGKSTYSARLAKACDAQVLHTDDFSSWDNPVHWWPRLEEQVLGPIAANQTARYQRYDWSRRTLAEWHTVIPGGILILEGVSAARAAVRERLSMSVWVETPRHIRLQRGLARDGDQAAPLWELWMSEEDAHFTEDRTREHADTVVYGVGGA